MRAIRKILRTMLTTLQLAKAINRHHQTIQRWVRKGWISSVMNSSRGPNSQVFDLGTVLKEMKARGLTGGRRK